MKEEIAVDAAYDAVNQKGQELKKKHGAKAVYNLKTYDADGNEYTAWIRKPNLDEISAYISVAQGGNNPVRGAQVLLNSTWLEGDEIIKTDEECFLGVMASLDNIIKVRIAKVTKH